jgi:hypothetical protein
MSEIPIAGKTYKYKPYTVGDRTKILNKFKTTELTPEVQKGIVELCVTEPKLTSEDMDNMPTVVFDTLFARIFQGDLNSDDFLQLLKSLSSQEQVLQKTS